MAVCRHCGAVFDDVLEYCPDCGQKNTDYVDESYLDSLLTSLVETEPVRPTRKTAKKEPKTEEPKIEEILPEEPEPEESVPEPEEILPEEPEPEESVPEPEEILPEEPEMEEFVPDISLTEEFSENENTEASEDDFFTPDEDLEKKAYNIFDELEDADVDLLIEQELEMGESDSAAADENAATDESAAADDAIEDIFSLFNEAEAENEPEPEEEPVLEELPELSELLGIEEPEQPGEPAEPEQPEPEELLEDVFALDENELDELAYAGLDDLLSDFDEDEAEASAAQEESLAPKLEEFLTAEDRAGSGEKGKKEKDKRSFWQRVFGNVPVDPSKKKPEPTEEEIAAAKQAKAEAKKKSAEEKKLAAEEKKEAAKRAKEEKAKQAQIKKEEKNKKKLEEAKKLVEEMEDTRINRLGASVIFIFFAVIAVALIIGSNFITYTVSIANAEKNFTQALNNDVKYYTEAYNHIFGLEMRNTEDQELEDKIITVMIVNKELNSYNSYMAMEDYESALHSLIKGMYRYGKYFEHALEIDVDQDMDFVRTQILKELEAVFDVSEDEAEVLRSLLEASLKDDEKAMEYSTEIYKVVGESDDLQ